jgi:RNA polymerase sigma factor (TIGR02999 family)
VRQLDPGQGAWRPRFKAIGLQTHIQKVLGFLSDPRKAGQETMAPRAEITQLLQAWNQGDQGAIEKLVPLVYDELHRLAHRYMADERPDHTLQTTELVNEAYLRLVDSAHVNWAGRTHFFGVCAQVMRRILVDWARSRQALKRGAGERALDLQEALAGEALGVAKLPCADLVAIDDALKLLTAIDQRKGQVVEMRFFGGLSVKETAEVLKISPETVQRDWKFARSWLQRELSGGHSLGS